MAQLLSAVTPGTLVKLNESGSPVQFYVAAQNYESSLNGAGRTLLVRKECYDDRVWDSGNVNAYASSDLDSWFNSTYKNMLDADIRSLIGTTKIRYTPGNGNNTVGTLERAIFALSLTELGQSHSYANTEGSALPIASTLRIAYRNGSATAQWTRSPYTYDAYYAWRLYSNGNIDYYYCGNSSGSRPAFTLPSSLYVSDDGAVVYYHAPSSITVPSIVMQGQPAPVSWATAPGADSYILQRKADGGEWTQVYAGALTTYTDTAGSWTTVQYQVCGVFDGTNGAFAQSDVITVVPTSTLVISGSDGSLGTITSDIPYSVATNTGNQIALTRTVNGSLVASLTVNSGFAYNIPVLDLPTGTGTIVITATVQTSSDPVTVTRTWTYTKAAQTFPGTGGVAQLAKDGQNVFPLTLAEAVKAIGGPWGGNLSTALDKLAKAATYTATAVPKYTEVTVDLSAVQPGDIVNLPENGVMVPFYVASTNYEPTLNTSGTRVLLVRKDVYQQGQWNSTNVNTYAGSTIDTWFNSTYKPMLDSTVLAEIGKTTFQYTPGNGDNDVTTLERAVFALSLAEFGLSMTGYNQEGSQLPAANLLKISNLNGAPADQWTRTPYTYNSIDVMNITGLGSPSPVYSNYDGMKYRPSFTLPATFSATYYVDPNTGTVHPEQEYATAGDFADLWGNIIPTVKIETGSYVGTGTYGSSNPNTLTFGFEPKVVFIGTDSQSSGVIEGSFVFVNPAKSAGGYVAVTTTGALTQGAHPVLLTWEGNSVSWYSVKNSYAQLNYQGYSKYYYIAIG